MGDQLTEGQGDQDQAKNHDSHKQSGPLVEISRQLDNQTFILVCAFLVVTIAALSATAFVNLDSTWVLIGFLVVYLCAFGMVVWSVIYENKSSGSTPSKKRKYVLTGLFSIVVLLGFFLAGYERKYIHRLFPGVFKNFAAEQSLAKYYELLGLFLSSGEGSEEEVEAFWRVCKRSTPGYRAGVLGVDGETSKVVDSGVAFHDFTSGQFEALSLAARRYRMRYSGLSHLEVVHFGAVGWGSGDARKQCIATLRFDGELSYNRFSDSVSSPSLLQLVTDYDSLVGGWVDDLFPGSDTVQLSNELLNTENITTLVSENAFELLVSNPGLDSYLATSANSSVVGHSALRNGYEVVLESKWLTYSAKLGVWRVDGDAEFGRERIFTQEPGSVSGRQSEFSHVVPFGQLVRAGPDVSCFSAVAASIAGEGSYQDDTGHDIGALLRLYSLKYPSKRWAWKEQGSASGFYEDLIRCLDDGMPVILKSPLVNMGRVKPDDHHFLVIYGLRFDGRKYTLLAWNPVKAIDSNGQYVEVVSGYALLDSYDPYSLRFTRTSVDPNRSSDSGFFSLRSYDPYWKYIAMQ